MGIIIGTVMIAVLVFVSVCTVLYFNYNNLSNKNDNVNIVGVDINNSNVDNSIVKVNTLATDNNGRKTVVIYPFKDCKEGITISWINKEN